jgi:hypothetical protein
MITHLLDHFLAVVQCSMAFSLRLGQAQAALIGGDNQQDANPSRKEWSGIGFS